MNKLFRNPVYPVDWLVLGYCLMMTVLLLILSRPVDQYVDELIFYVGTALLVVLIVNLIGERQKGIFRFIRLLYPAILFTAFYRMTGGTMFLLHDHFMDPQLTSFEQSLLGVEPSHWLDQFLPNQWLTEIVMGTYFSYYLMLPALLLPLFLTKRYDLIRQSLAAISLTFFIGYTLFFLYPVEGPRWHFLGQYQHTVDGPFFRQLVELVQAKGSVRGGCVPSTHVAVALIVMAYFFKISRPVGWLLLIINLGMAFGTVWGRYHYVTDVLVGSVIAALAYWLVDRYHPDYELSSARKAGNIQMRVQNVS
jgi:membrane-associated phospholipid phosphatase